MVQVKAHSDCSALNVLNSILTFKLNVNVMVVIINNFGKLKVCTV
jgi:hypothetical protein